MNWKEKALNIDMEKIVSEVIKDDVTIKYEAGWDAFRRALSDVGAAIKDKSNPHFRSKYATLEACNAAVKPVCSDNKLTVNHKCVISTDGDYILTEVRYKGLNIDHSSFKFRDVRNMQSAGSAVTYAKRYNIALLFNLDTEDDDGNAAVAKKITKNTTSDTPSEGFGF